MYLKHEKNLLITVCSGALRERYGRVTPPFLAGVLQKVKRQNLLITVCRRALRSLVLRTQIGSFRSCSLRKKAAGRPPGRSREIRKKSPKIPLESGD